MFNASTPVPKIRVETAHIVGSFTTHSRLGIRGNKWKSSMVWIILVFNHSFCEYHEPQDTMDSCYNSWDLQMGKVR